ncbi:hypothetical protein V1264_018529 [Littorina saxatilis]
MLEGQGVHAQHGVTTVTATANVACNAVTNYHVDGLHQYSSMTSIIPDQSVSSSCAVTRDGEEMTSQLPHVTYHSDVPVSLSSEAMHSSEPTVYAPAACVYPNSDSYAVCANSYGTTSTDYGQSRHFSPSFMDKTEHNTPENNVNSFGNAGTFVQDELGKEVPQDYDAGTSCFFADCGFEESFYPSDHWHGLRSYFQSNGTMGHPAYNEQSVNVSANEYTDRRKCDMRQQDLGGTGQAHYNFIPNAPSNIFHYPQNYSGMETSGSFFSTPQQFHSSTFSGLQSPATSASLYAACERDIQSNTLQANNPFHDNLIQGSQWCETDIDGPDEQQRNSSFVAYQDNKQDSREINETRINGTAADTKLTNLQNCPNKHLSAAKEGHLQGRERIRQAQEHSAEMTDDTSKISAKNGSKHIRCVDEPDTSSATLTLRFSDRQLYQQNQTQQQHGLSDQFHTLAPERQQSQPCSTSVVTSDPRFNTKTDSRLHCMFPKSFPASSIGAGHSVSQHSPSSSSSSGKSLSKPECPASDVETNLENMTQTSNPAHPAAAHPAAPRQASSPRFVSTEPRTVTSSEKCGGTADPILHDDDDSSLSMSPSSSTTSLIDVDHLLSSGVTVAGFKPRPIIRKRCKVMMPLTSKDSNYWRKRKKNNDSAKRSREAKKEKEKNFYRRALELEYENYFLKDRLGQLEAQLHAVTGIAPTPHEYVVPPAHEYVAVNTPPDVLFM